MKSLNSQLPWFCFAYSNYLEFHFISLLFVSGNPLWTLHFVWVQRLCVLQKDYPSNLWGYSWAYQHWICILMLEEGNSRVRYNGNILFTRASCFFWFLGKLQIIPCAGGGYLYWSSKPSHPPHEHDSFWKLSIVNNPNISPSLFSKKSFIKRWYYVLKWTSYLRSLFPASKSALTTD